MAELKTIIISRTDNIGDVVLTLPLAKALKQKYPACTIFFIGKAYTHSVIEACSYIDKFLDRSTVIENDFLTTLQADAIVHVFPDKQVARAAKNAKIPLRIGTSHRWYHWWYCNHRIHFSRKQSDLHESILNFKLLVPFQIAPPELQSINRYYGLDKLAPLEIALQNVMNTGKINIVLHPKSKGSAREWPMHQYQKLIRILPENLYHFFITGTANEGEKIKKEADLTFQSANVTDMTGKMSLSQLISFLNGCNALVACSTGPLHLAAALGKHAIGIFPPMKPIHSGRWGALGKHAKNLSIETNCADCRTSTKCLCIEMISPESVAQELLKLR